MFTVNITIFIISHSCYKLYTKWPYRLTVRTHPSQGWNQSSILCRVTKKQAKRFFCDPKRANCFARVRESNSGAYVFAPAKIGELVPRPKFLTKNFESRAISL